MVECSDLFSWPRPRVWPAKPNVTDELDSVAGGWTLMRMAVSYGAVLIFYMLAAGTANHLKVMRGRPSG